MENILIWAKFDILQFRAQVYVLYISLYFRDDYEVSCSELDELVEIAMGVDGVLGSRMTGGGFGGCTVTLAKSKCIPTVLKVIKAKYKRNPTFYVCGEPRDGSKIINI